MFKNIFKGPQLSILIVVIALSGWLVTAVDGGAGDCWTFDVIRNWQEAGFRQLHGQMVTNPGGFDVVDHPSIYRGHRAFSLYPAFVCAQLFPWSGNPLLLYYLVCAVAVWASTWGLLGRGRTAFLVASLVVLCPGYIRWQVTLDPNLVCVLAGFPFCAIVIGLLSRPRVSGWGFLGLFFLVGIYSELNWTTAFVHAMLFVTLLVMRQVSWRRLAIYTGFTGIALLAVVTSSVINKMGHSGESVLGDAPNATLSDLVRGYMWGNAAYGLGLSTKTALARLIVVNTIAFLPLLLFLTVLVWRRRKGLQRSGFLFMLPFCAAAGQILVLRNYFAHHPWMSCHFLLLGGVLSLCAWHRGQSGNGVPVEQKLSFARIDFLRGMALVLLAGIYGYVVIIVGRQYDANEYALISFVRDHTSRPTPIVVDPTRDPELAGVAVRLTGLLDRRIVVTTNFTAWSASPKPYLLTAMQNPVAGRLVGANANSQNQEGAVQSVLNWYGQHISHRRPGDKPVVADAYFLYDPIAGLAP